MNRRGYRVLCRVLHTLVGWLPNPTRVLLYHGIDHHGGPLSVSPAVFQGQLAWLAAHRHTVWPASRYVQALRSHERLPRRLVVITFDDGLASTVQCALPLLAAHGFPASVFVVTDNIGRSPDWYRRDHAAIAAQLQSIYSHGDWSPDSVAIATSNALAEPLADWPALLAGRQQGLEVLSHSATHPFLDRLDDAQIRDELTRSRAALLAAGCDEPPILAWPYGASDARVERAAAAAGAVAAFGSEPGPSTSLLRIGRTPVDPRLGVFGIAFALGRGSTVWQWLQRLRRGRGRR